MSTAGPETVFVPRLFFFLRDKGRCLHVFVLSLGLFVTNTISSYQSLCCVPLNNNCWVRVHE